MASEWIDCRNYEPLASGYFLIQTIYGGTTQMQYTPEYGWNTSIDEDGTPHNKFPLNNGYVVRWCDPGEPPEVPKEWLDEYNEYWDRKLKG